MWQDIRRICEHPTDEDRRWFPDIAGSRLGETLDFAMRNFKDESFIAQYLSPKLMRDFKLFAVVDDDRKRNWRSPPSTTTPGYRQVRQILAEQYNLGNREPNIQVWNVDVVRRPLPHPAPLYAQPPAPGREHPGDAAPHRPAVGLQGCARSEGNGANPTNQDLANRRTGSATLTARKPLPLGPSLLLAPTPPTHP
jgi:hypothetical protein